MARDRIEKTNNAEQIVEVEEKSAGIFQKLFYLVLIPLLFVIAVLLVIATFTDFNVFEKATELTGISSEKKSVEEPTDDFNNKIVELEAQIKEKEAEIDQLQSQLDSAKAENENSEAIQEQLQEKISSLQQNQSDAKKEFDDILSTFEQMSAKSAAPILIEMSDDEALKILSNMKPETLSAIFSKMDPVEAAKYSELLAK